MTKKRFDFIGNYITLDGGVFATTKNRQNAELISRTLNKLKHQVNYLEDRLDELIVLKNENNDLKKENKELQERNNRQAETIRELYNLIENKDWETLTAHMMELNKAEEQLRREWQTYMG